jgi:hypothetical protein
MGPFTIMLSAPLVVSNGAAVTIDGSDAGRNDLTLDGNHSVRAFEVRGGNSSLALHNVTEQNGGGVSQGAGAYVDSGASLTLQGSTFRNNAAVGASPGDADGGDAQGGAMYNLGTLALVRSTLAHNSAVGGNGASGVPGGGGGNGGEAWGGAVYTLGSLTVTQSTLAHNSATGGNGGDGVGADYLGDAPGGNGGDAHGGALYSSGSTSMVSNTIADGTLTAGSGGQGGVCFEWPDPRCKGQYFPDGLPGTSSGGDLYVADPTLVVANTIIAVGLPDECQQPLNAAADHGYNLKEGGTCGLSAPTDRGGDPQLGDLAANGGPTQTMAIGPDSPAIDQIPLAACVDAQGRPLTADQRGMPRPSPANGLCDIGAYEYQVPLSPTTTRLTSSTAMSSFGQTVVFSAMVHAAAGTPGGTVTFKDGSIVLGTAPLANGVSTFATHSLSVGAHAIVAAYGGTSGFGSSAGLLIQRVVLATTITTLTSSANPATAGQTVTFSAGVSAVAPGSGTLTGMVIFKDGATMLGTGTVSSGHATMSISGLSVGAHRITAVYGGDAGFGPSAGTTVQTVISKVTLTSSANPAVYGQAVTLTAGVSPVPAAGSVTFKDGVSTLGTVAVTGGIARFVTGTLAVGTHRITASFSGGGISMPLSQTVARAATATSVSGSPNPSAYGQVVTFTATVHIVVPGRGLPTGTVTFKDGAITVLGTTTLNANGTARFSTSSLSAGVHAISAIYAGDVHFTTSAGATNQTVH